MSFAIPFPVGILSRRLDNGLILGECLFFPDLSRLGNARSRVRERLERNVEQRLTEIPPAALGRHRLATKAEVRSITISLDPPRRTLAWRSPLELRFPVVCWRHGTEAFLARVPDLGIEVIAPRPDDLDELLAYEIRSALFRSKLSVGLHRLAGVQRTEKLELDWVKLTVRLPSMKQRAQKAEEATDERKPSVLAQVATDLTKISLPPAYEMEEVVAQLADALTARRPQSVLLIGPSGVGKTAAVGELVRSRRLYQLGLTPFYRTSGSRLVAGMSGFGMWQERCRDLWCEASKRRAVLHAGNLVELMEVGKSEHNQSGIAGFLRPYVARGDLLVIAECTPEQVPLIEREDPQLLDAFLHVRVAEPDADRGRIILNRFVQNAPLDLRHTLAPTALDTLDRLHRRYATYSAYPGRPLRFLQNLLQDLREDRYVAPGDVLAAFSRETGLPRVLLDPAVPLDLEATRGWFGGRVIGQGEAVDRVTEVLATVKAGLTRPNRPIASLLFIGPTGVGKTEMAKALAEFLFGSPARLTRFDMSEYADPVAVQRLIGGAFGSEGLLTAKVREQPFSVLLLDEFEKAHPRFFDLLLQVLGEARLTDAAGRLADFRNAVVVLTSNLGAESYQQGGIGFAAGDAVARESAHEHFLRAVQEFLRPEMFNRIDRVVPFAPLDEETVRRIADREWQKVLARDGVRYRGVEVRTGPEVLPHLARAGFDARYGARPLKRAIEREVLAPLAHQMNRYPADAALEVQVGSPAGKLTIGVRPRQTSANPANSESGELAEACADMRRWYQLLNRCSAVRDLRNDLTQLERLEREVARRPKRRAAVQEQLAQLARLRLLANDLAEQSRDSATLEEAALLDFYGQSADGPDGPTPRQLRLRLAELTRKWDRLLLQLYNLRCPEPNAITLVLFSESRARLFELALAYAAIARNEGLGLTAVQYLLPASLGKAARPAEDDRAEDEAEEPDPDKVRYRWRDDRLVKNGPGVPPGLEVWARKAVGNPFDFLREPKAEVLGLGLRFTGEGAYLRFAAEGGLHVFRPPAEEGATEPDRCLVEVSELGLHEYAPPEALSRRGAIGKQPRRRTYDREAELADDPELGLPLPWSGRDLPPLLADALTRRMRATLQAMVRE